MRSNSPTVLLVGETSWRLSELCRKPLPLGAPSTAAALLLLEELEVKARSGEGSHPREPHGVAGSSRATGPGLSPKRKESWGVT